ncbi:competence protein CoiA family protein [Flavobacterium gilvum]|uniref:Competence protein CoiA-like N-terminal domain-containing protein n=1 Tax=Flavobacterium gilvum TaxID=1492737 RepID=A0AAC9I5F3_9FLAO|nr:competence protein CoiA family protein [Flavobacterium gilvum]AOW09937.1 hypothetical protein EM308_10675 [Flavobacterium gilvum]KFC59604.1 hypothetical protein FEM08_15960 [Flavobacterium gilvum]
MMIKYQYAKDENEKLINIDSLNGLNRNKFKFFCISCGNELIARLGKIKIHHFAHKKVVTCSGETYLHLLGKQLFFDNYTDCLQNRKPFIIELNQKRTCNHYEKELGLKCKLSKITTQFDLTKYFDKISVETREDSFIADILLTSKNGKDKVFIEIAVTHLSTEQKLKSNYRIIEIEIESEEDFMPIKRKYLSIKDSKIKFENFKTGQVITSLCNGNCQNGHNFFTLDVEGRCLLKQRNLKQIKNQLSADKEKIVKYEITKDNGYNYSDIFKKSVATYAQQNLKVKNCFICRYHAENNSWQYFEDTSGIPIFCKFLKIKCNSNQAITCEYYKLENNFVNELLSTIKLNEAETEGGYLGIEEESDDDN